jgi:hypothetical protein
MNKENTACFNTVESGFSIELKTEEKKLAPLVTQIYYKINNIVYFYHITLNLSFLNLYHVLYKQLQINIKYTFKLAFLLHVLILKAKYQLFPRCRP